jgi:hypothetical protein
MMKACTECARHSIKLNISRIGDKWPLHMASIERGIWSIVGLDLVGPYRFIAGPVTRANKVQKVWVLVMVCQLSSAVNFCYLQSYSTDSFIQAFANHGNQFRFPSIITADQGSQIKAATKRITRSMSIKENTEDCDEDVVKDGDNWNKMLAETAKKFKETKWHLAPTEAQSQNGCAEANIRVVKKLLRSHQRLLRGQKTIFKSLLDLQSVFCRIGVLLISRPLKMCAKMY